MGWTAGQVVTVVAAETPLLIEGGAEKVLARSELAMALMAPEDWTREAPLWGC